METPVGTDAPNSERSRRLDSRVLVVIEAIFLLSRVLYALLGVRFDSSPLQYFWSYIDPELLRHDLFRSVWYGHANPPLYNLFLGGVLHVAGRHETLWFHLIYVGAGMVLVAALYTLLRDVGARWLVSSALVLLIALNPWTALYENWLYVEYFVMVLLVVGALMVGRYFITGRRGYLIAFFSVAGVVVLSRSNFHLVWFAALVALVIAMRRSHWREVVAAASLPFALCAGLYTKNLVQFGSFTGSTCLGINLARVSTNRLSDTERQDLVRHGVLSRYAVLNPLWLPYTTPDAFAHEPHTGVPSLDRVKKSTGWANFENSRYVSICEAYQRDALTVLRRKPLLLPRSFTAGTLIYLRPAGDYAFFSKENRRHVHPLERPFDLLLGQLHAGRNQVHPRLDEVAWVVVAAYAAAGIAAVLIVCRRKVRHSLPPAVLAIIGFAMLTTLYVSLVGNFLEVGENNRFRFVVDPLVLVTIIAVLVGRRTPLDPVRSAASDAT